MNLRTRYALVATAAGILTLCLTAPASAAGDTTATVTVTGGALEINVPTAAGNLGAALVGYSAGTIVKTGTAEFAPNDPGNLTGVSPAVTSTGITGDNSATWTPTIHVAVAGGKVAAVYSAVITHSVA